jgi:hypothetical protein
MQRRFLTYLAVAAGVTAAVPAVATAMPYGVHALWLVSGPTPFPAGCPGAAFDNTMIPGQEVEPSITANPTNPRNVVAAWIQDIGPVSPRTDLAASSVDGGRTWKRSTIPGLTKCEGGLADGAADPWVGAGAGGELYFTGLAAQFPGDAPESAVVTSHSTDGGRTWHSPVALTDPVEGNETPFVTGSPTRPDRAYEVWAEFASGVIKFSATETHAATWSAPIVIDPSVLNAIDLAPRLLVLPNGTLVTIFARANLATGEGNVYATHSRDAGKTWTPAVSLAPNSNSIQTFVDDKGDELPQPQYPNAAVAPDGTIYATIEADTSASLGAVFVWRSTDGGATWHRVTSPGTGAYAFEPTIAVDSHGTIGMTWYDLRNDGPGDAVLTADVWFASSRDRGGSWRETHVAGPTDLRTGALARQNHVGEYQGLAAVRGRGFAAILTLAAPFAKDGPTDIFYADIRPGR